MTYLLSRALGLVITKLNQETFLALMGLTGLVWLVDRPTPIRLEKPNVHFGLLELHRVTGQESKRAPVREGRMRGSSSHRRVY